MAAEKLSEYEMRRLKNIEDNKRVLAELGLLNPYLRLSISKRSIESTRQSLKSTKARTPKLKRRRDDDDSDEENVDPMPTNKRRRSARLRGIEPDSAVLPSSDDEEDETGSKKLTNAHRDNSYGHIEGIPVGTWWPTRMECSSNGVHRPTVAGIHGSTETGAYSVALSGGYEDNVDLGECFTYTGEGGRDLKGTRANPKNLRTGPQTKDQTLTRGNLALSQSVKTGNPVRVIRGYKLPTDFAPESGYRYDGLYTVKKCWFTCGSSGYGVWKFAFQRCEDQDPLPFVVTQQSSDGMEK